MPGKEKRRQGKRGDRKKMERGESEGHRRARQRTPDLETISKWRAEGTRTIKRGWTRRASIGIARAFAALRRSIRSRSASGHRVHRAEKGTRSARVDMIFETHLQKTRKSSSDPITPNGKLQDAVPKPSQEPLAGLDPRIGFATNHAIKGSHRNVIRKSDSSRRHLELTRSENIERQAPKKLVFSSHFFIFGFDKSPLFREFLLQSLRDFANSDTAASNDTDARHQALFSVRLRSLRRRSRASEFRQYKAIATLDGHRKNTFRPAVQPAKAGSGRPTTGDCATNTLPACSGFLTSSASGSSPKAELTTK